MAAAGWPETDATEGGKKQKHKLCPGHRLIFYGASYSIVDRNVIYISSCAPEDFAIKRPL